MLSFYHGIFFVNTTHNLSENYGFQTFILSIFNINRLKKQKAGAF